MMWKKTIAVFVAGATMCSMLSFPAFAKASAGEVMPFDELIAQLAEEDDNISSNMTDGLQKISSPVQSQKLSITLGDSLKGLAQMLFGLNLNELNSLDMLVSAKVDEEGEQAEMTLQLNETSIASALFNFNFNTTDMTCVLPELSSKALVANLKDMLDEESAQTLEQLLNMIGKNMNITEELDPKEVRDTLFKYDEIVRDHMDVLTEEKVDLEYVDVKQEVSEYCLDLPDNKYAPLAQALVEALKEDELIGGILDQLEMDGSEVKIEGEEVAFSKDDFFEILDEMVENLQETYEDAVGNTGLLFYVDFDEDLVLRGFQVDAYELDEVLKNYEHTVLFILQCPAQDNVTALNVYTGDDFVTLCGTGSKEADGQFDGYYYVYYMDEPVAEIELLDCYSEDDSMGASLIFKPAQVEGGDDQEEDEIVASINEFLNMLQGFALYVDFSQEGKESYTEMGLNYGEDNYVALSFTGYDPDKVQFADMSKYADKADIYDENQVDEFVNSIDVSKIFENIEAAGISEDTLASVMALFG